MQALSLALHCVMIGKQETRYRPRAHHVQPYPDDVLRQRCSTSKHDSVQRGADERAPAGPREDGDIRRCSGWGRQHDLQALPVCGHDTQAQPHHPPHPQQLQVGILPLPAALRLLLSICRETPIWCSYASLSVIWSLTADKPRLKSLSMALEVLVFMGHRQPCQGRMHLLMRAHQAGLIPAGGARVMRASAGLAATCRERPALQGLSTLWAMITTAASAWKLTWMWPSMAASTASALIVPSGQAASKLSASS